jgi:hypothetical protein
MADGDFDVKTLIKSRFAGGGHNLQGVASNDKVEVVAEITGTYNTGGITLTANYLGLVTIDALVIGCNVYHSTLTAPTGTIPNLGVYIATSGLEGNLLLVDDASTQIEADDSETFAVVVLAYGDDLKPNLV